METVNDLRGPEPGPDRARRDVRDLTWPLLIIFGLILVMVVNFTFIWIAAGGQDPVVESYMTEAR